MTSDAGQWTDAPTVGEWAGLPRQPRTQAITEDLGSGLRMHLRIAERGEAQTLLVLMPAAQSQIEKGQINPLFSRWNWIPDYPDSHVIAVSDPALYQGDGLAAAWFVSPGLDVLARIAKAVSAIAGELGVGQESIVVYGSSLGGFGSLSLASLLAGARAVAEIPQLDLQRWPVPTALAALEDSITGKPLDSYRQDRPEQLDVLSRFRTTGVVPGFLLITNPEDKTYREHLEFMGAVRSLGAGVEVKGASRLQVETRVSGHRVLPREDAAILLGEELARKG
ncbi:hypothetical protein ACXET9_09300 [Brachybacterium sp. DNPG3]